MTVKYKTVITKAGAIKLAAATLPDGKKVNLTAMAVGDGGGTLPVPDPNQTKLVKEVWRHALNKISQDRKNKNYVVAELLIPPETGGFWMRELGLYDDTGTLIAVGNMAESYKPALAEGSGRAQTVRMVIMVSDIESVELTIDTTTVMATQDYVDDKLAEHEQSRRHPDATLTAKGFTQLSSATDSASESVAATPKAVKAAYDLAKGKYTAQDATTAQKGIVQLSSATDSTSESVAATPKAVKAAYDLAKGKYTAQDATTAQKGIVQLSSATDSASEALAATPKAVKAANDNANGRVPSGRKINGRALSADISITAQDIFNGQTVGIGNAADLNAYTTPGLYYQPANAQAQTGRNYPEANAGSLEVYKHAGITQIYRVYNNSRSYIRTLYSGTWSAWIKQYDAANKPSPADIGAVAKGGDTMSGTLIQDAVPQGTYNYTALSTDTTGVKNYLRKFRGGSGDTIWHETAQGGEYRLATGNTDGQEEFGISTVSGVRARGNITSQSGALYSGSSKKLGILSTGQSEKNATLRLWGSADRPTIVELGDDSGYHYYSQRNANGSISFQFNGSAGFGGGITSSGEIISRYANGLRIAYGNYGTFWRNDGGNLYLMITNSGDQLGSYNSLRPFVVNLASGDVTINKLTLANYASFDARYYTKAQSDAGYMAKTGAYTKAESDGRYVTQVRLGSVTSSGQIGNKNLSYGSGIVLTGIYGSANYTVNLSIYYRAVQYLINGVWYTATSA
ncbi:phage tail protein [Enterobacter cloacae]|uniref:phage tail-collar fiber domain-containing protein n=1 Tax=Enterobacter cloacae TaxID=550 RepID=UPI002FF686AA